MTLYDIIETMRLEEQLNLDREETNKRKGRLPKALGAYGIRYNCSDLSYGYEEKPDIDPSNDFEPLNKTIQPNIEKYASPEIELIPVENKSYYDNGDRIIYESDVDKYCDTKPASWVEACEHFKIPDDAFSGNFHNTLERTEYYADEIDQKTLQKRHQDIENLKKHLAELK